MVDNKLEPELGASIGFLVNLRKLDLTGNGIKVLAAQIGELTLLEELILVENSLNFLPDTLVRLTGLMSLSVSANALISVPVGIGFMSSLTFLDIAENYLVDLPKTTGRLTDLTDLNISENDLLVLPTSIGYCTSLVSFDATQNPRMVLPSGRLAGSEVETVLGFLQSMARSEGAGLLDMSPRYILNLSPLDPEILKANTEGAGGKAEEGDAWDDDEGYFLNGEELRLILQSRPKLKTI